MATPIQITTSEENTNVQIRPISNIYEFENGVFLDQSNFYFDDKTNPANPFLASIEIKDESGEVHWINYKIANAANIQRKSVSDNKIVYTIDDYEIEYIVSEGQLKENIILNNPINQREFKFSLKLSQWLEYRIENNEVIFFDIRNDQALLKIPAPSMTDAVGRTSNQIEYVFGVEGEYKTLSVVVNDEEFLSNAIYPVEIDPTTVNITAGVTAVPTSQQRIVRNSSGDVFVVYIYNYNVYVRKITSNTSYRIIASGWATSGTEIKINSTSGTSTYPCSKPSIAIDSANRLHIVWEQKTSGVNYYQIYYAQIANLATPQTISYTGAISGVGASYIQSTASIATDSTDNLHLVWYGYDSGHTSYYQCKYIKGTNVSGTVTWGSWVNICPKSDSLNYINPAIGFDSSNNLHVVLESNNKILYIKGSNGGTLTWDADYTTIDTIGNYPSIAIDSNNVIHLFYISNNLPKYTNSSNWETNKKTGFETSGTNTNPILTIDNNNYLYLFWNKGGTLYRRSKSVDSGLNWSTNDIAATTSIEQSSRWSKFNFNLPSKVDTYYGSGGITYSDLTPVIPNAPTSLVVTDKNSSSITFSWTHALVETTGFKLYKNGVLVNKTIGAVNTITINTVDTPLIPNTPYDFYIKAYNIDYDSSTSNTVTVAPHLKLQGSGVSSKVIKWSWDAVSTVTQYKIYATQVDFLADTNPVGIVNAPTLEYYERNLPTPNQSYTRYIKAFNGTNLVDLSIDDSSNPLGASASTLPVLVAPTVPIGSNPTSTQIKWDWTDSINSGVTHYQILEGFDTNSNSTDDHFEIRGEVAGTVVNGIVTVAPAKTFTETNLRYDTPYQRYICAVRKVSTIAGSGLTTDDDEYMISVKSSVVMTGVKINPIIKTPTFNQSNCVFQDTYVNYNNSTNYAVSNNLFVDGGTVGVQETLIQFPIPDDIETVNLAKLGLAYSGTQTEGISANINMKRNTSIWNYSTVSSTTKPSVDSSIVSTVLIDGISSKIGTYYQFDITNLVDQWRKNIYPNYGINLSMNSGSNYKIFSSSRTVNKPYFYIEYLCKAHPTVPTNFQGSIKNTSTITWSWNVSTNSPFEYRLYDAFNNMLYKIVPVNTTSYNWYKATKQPDGTYTFGSAILVNQDISTTISFDETSLSMGATYPRYVVAYNAIGESQGSDVESVMMGYYAPQNFTGTAIDYHTIQWTWQDTQNTGVDYEIYDTNDVKLATILNGSPKVWTETDLTPTESRTRKIKAVSGSLGSSFVEATASAGTLLPPSTVVVSVQSSSRIVWSFDQYLDITEYYLYNAADTRIGRIIYEGGVWKAYWGTAPEVLQNTYSTPQIEQSKTDTSTTLNPETSMTLKVTSKYGSYESPTKASASATTNALPQCVGFTGTLNGLNDITWTIQR